MSFLVSDLTGDAAVKLNDRNQRQYTDDYLLPFVQDAVRSLNSKLLLNGVNWTKPTADEQTFSSGTTVYTPLPTGFVSPIRLWERDAGSVDDSAWIPMTERTPIPNVEPANNIRYWSFQVGSILLKSALESREVKLEYYAKLTVPASVGASIPLEEARLYLLWQTLAEVFLLIKGQTTNAKASAEKANLHLEELIGDLVQQGQGESACRRPYVAFS